MAPQEITTAIISFLVVLLALQLLEEQSLTTILEQSYNTIVSVLDYTIWSDFLQKDDGKILCRIAQFGALVLLRRLYTQIILPLYLAFSTRNNSGSSASTANNATPNGIITLKQRYGSWCIIVGDLDLGDVSLMREYAKDFISKGMNVLILDCSSENDNKKELDEREEHMRKEVVKLFMEDLRLCASEYNETENIDSEYSSDDDDDEHEKIDDTSPKVDILLLKDGTMSKFCSTVNQKLGDIAQSGGIGILVHCFSSQQVSLKETKQYTPSYKKYGTEKFLSVLNLTLPYMIFRGTGAIINVSREDHDDEKDHFAKIPPQYQSTSSTKNFEISSKARDVAECAFYTQLIRSLHYEYGEYGIDSLAVTLSKKKGLFDADVVVRSSLQMLGEDSELDLKICKFVGMLKSFYSEGKYRMSQDCV